MTSDHSGTVNLMAKSDQHSQSVEVMQGDSQAVRSQLNTYMMKNTEFAHDGSLHPRNLSYVPSVLPPASANSTQQLKPAT